MSVDRRHFLAAGAIATAVAPALGMERETKMNRHKVLIIVGDATETVDTLYPYYRLIEGGYEPVVAAPEKRVYQMVMHEVKPGWTITKEWEGYTIKADVAFKDINPEDYAGIFFSGGRAPEYIREDQDLLRIRTLCDRPAHVFGPHLPRPWSLHRALDQGPG